MDIYEEIYNKNKRIIDIAIEQLKICENDPLHFVGHTIDVVNYVKELLEKIPANKEVCIIAAYWHDVGRSIIDKGHEEGSVLPDGNNGSSMGSEHMYSFDHAYKISSVRDWLFEQSNKKFNK